MTFVVYPSPPPPPKKKMDPKTRYLKYAAVVTIGNFFTPLNPNSDQHQISPCNINTSILIQP